jgi:hypothetical protein
MTQQQISKPPHLLHGSQQLLQVRQNSQISVYPTSFWQHMQTNGWLLSSTDPSADIFAPKKRI